ncbi:MAG: HEAT repeat domain-containing protein [Myxococcales bacterium]|nr:HEAT repeat domain-containing protein [Myxococcales bacterium]
MSTCPTCQKPVDPLRSRFVKVRDGKVVAYCSAEHMQASETKPTAMPVATGPAAAEKRARTPASGIPAGTSPSLETGPVIEVVKDRKDATAPVAAKPVAKTRRSEPRIATPPPIEDGSLDPWNAGEEGDEDGGGRASITMTAPKKNTAVVIAVIAVLGAVGAYLAYRFLLVGDQRSSEPATDPSPPPPPRPVDAAPAPKAVSPTEAVTRARDVLVKQLASESPRVQRVAASALARTGDTKAIEYLIGALAKETSNASRLELAYALARAGDKKGIDTLVAAMQSGQRDPRIEAGRKLALLGDRRAAPVLAGYLEVSQLRLGAAEALAYVADPAGIKALEQVRVDAKASADDKARATIALAIAGRSDVIPDLQALLQDARFNAFAASALAQLRDPSGKPVLVEQLAVPSLRVEAARALRRLDPALDPGAYLPQLLASLDSHKDTEQVQVAEALLLLAGDPGWSEHP